MREDSALSVWILLMQVLPRYYVLNLQRNKTGVFLLCVVQGNRRGFALSVCHTQVGIRVTFLTQEFFLKILLFKLAACLSFRFWAKQVPKELSF